MAVDRSTWVRPVSAAVCLACVAVLGLAATLTPNDGGMRTHQQLGLPGCTLLEVTGVPCPSCGMTTSFAHAANGQFIRSFLAQPFGMILAVVTAMTALVAGYIAVTGNNIVGYLRPVWNRRLGIFVGVLFIGAWVYKIIYVATCEV